MSNFRTRAKLKIGHQSRPAATLKPIVRNVVRDSRLMLAERPANAKLRAQEARKYIIDLRSSTVARTGNVLKLTMQQRRAGLVNYGHRPRGCGLLVAVDRKRI